MKKLDKRQRLARRKACAAIGIVWGADCTIGAGLNPERKTASANPRGAQFVATVEAQAKERTEQFDIRSFYGKGKHSGGKIRPFSRDRQQLAGKTGKTEKRLSVGRNASFRPVRGQFHSLGWSLMDAVIAARKA